MKNNLEKLERTVLELGTEIYRLRHMLTDVKGQSRHIQDAFKSLQKILDEKGLISKEDFDISMTIDKHTEHSFNAHDDQGYENELKKKHH